MRRHPAGVAYAPAAGRSATRARSRFSTHVIGGPYTTGE